MRQKIKKIIVIICVLSMSIFYVSYKNLSYGANKKNLDDIVFYIEDNKLYVKVNENTTLLENERSGKRLPVIICYDEKNNVYYYDTHTYIKNNECEFNIEKVNISNNNKVSKNHKDKLLTENVVFDTEYMRYLGDIGDNSMYVTKGLRLYSSKKNTTKLVEDIGIDEWTTITNNYLDEIIAINSFNKKIYYLKDPRNSDIYKSLYELNEKMEKNIIANNVRHFIALKNEVLYVNDALYRYKDNNVEKLMDAVDVYFVGRHNDTKCYMNVKTEVPLSDKFYLDERQATEREKFLFNLFSQVKVSKNTLYIYENGEFVKVSDSENMIIPEIRLGEKPLGVECDKFLAFEVASGEKINFHDFYDSLNDEEKNDNELVRKKAEQIENPNNKYYAWIVSGYDIYKTEIGSIAIGSRLKELFIYDGYARYVNNTETFEIFFGDNLNKKERINQKKQESDEKISIIPVVKMTNN